ncbi:MAG: HepT-like ribonuclease domain-containing protein [Pseudonocardiaceae bacterium]
MRSDEERLLDILDESRLVLKYVPTSREEFDADEVVQAALTRWLQNIGEAASRLSTELRSRCDDVPWQSIMGMRHRVVHDYFNIDLSVVWRACTVDVPTAHRGRRTPCHRLADQLRPLGGIAL